MKRMEMNDTNIIYPDLSIKSWEQYLKFTRDWALDFLNPFIKKH